MKTELEKIVQADKEPRNPGTGEMYYNTKTRNIHMWDGDCWIILAPIDTRKIRPKPNKRELLKRFRLIMEEE
jgi:hypothetical protein